MTLPASFPLSMSQVATELGLSLPLSINHAWVLALANKAALPASFSDLLGKTGRFDGSLTATNSGQTTLISFSGAPWFSSSLNICSVTPVLGSSVLDFNAVPNYTGNVIVKNNTTGISLVFSQQSGAVWGANSAPANLLRSGITDSFTVLPSN